MALKDIWIPKKNDVDDVDANDINSIADATIKNESDIEGLKQNSESINTSIQNLGESINSNTNEIENLQQKSESINKSIQDLDESINTNTNEIENLKEIVEDLQEPGGGTGGGGSSGEITQDVTSSILLTMYNEVDVILTDEDLFLFDEETATIKEIDISTEDKWNRVSALEECIVPYSINGIIVKNIDKLNNISNAKKIRFPNSIINIGDNACSSLLKLKSINIPTSCEYIGTQAFSSTPIIEVITPIKPNWEIEYGEGVFQNTPYLNNIDTVIDGIKTIPKKAFFNCEALITVTISESTDFVGEQAFGGDLSNVKIITVLNPDTELSEGFCNSNVTIKGYTGSTAETYAENNSHKFIAIDEIINPSEYYTKNEIDDLVGDIDSLLAEV